MILVVSVLLLVYAAARIRPQLGKQASGARLERMRRSPNYRDGVFHNQSITPALTEGESYFSAMRKFMFGRSKRVKPGATIPSVKQNLASLPVEEDLLVWFGHSSYYMHLAGKRILVDPVFSGNASPIPGTNRSFAGADVYTASDMPPIDYLFITHDHFDHLDHATMRALRSQVKQVVTGLGVGAHLEAWGYDPRRIIELDWDEQTRLEEGILVTAAPSRHFSGRDLHRNRTLWVSFIVQTTKRKLYLGGDSGYDTHFKRVGDAHGPFDLAILENGQYNENWKYIHMMPEETVQAAVDLQAARLFPVHWAKFALSLHDWDEPIHRVITEAERHRMPLVHPLIGEVLRFESMSEGTKWWEDPS
jgi:L-ascorbate metabolism protein UlaG (beta-lactamase superfamily)